MTKAALNASPAPIVSTTCTCCVGNVEIVAAGVGFRAGGTGEGLAAELRHGQSVHIGPQQQSFPAGTNLGGDTVSALLGVKAGFEISRQEKQIRKYAGEIEQMDDRIRSLTSSRDSLEKFAREHFHFAERKGTYVILKMDVDYRPAPLERKQVFGVTFEQGRNEIDLNDASLFAQIPTENKTFTEAALRDLKIALITLKYTQSNSVCYAKDGVGAACTAVLNNDSYRQILIAFLGGKACKPCVGLIGRIRHLCGTGLAIGLVGLAV